LVAKPQAGLDTRLIFSDPGLKRDTDLAIIAGFAADPYGFGHNDLQPVAQKLCPDIVQTIAWLAFKGLTARMTGSGSAVFAPFTGAVDTQNAPPGLLIKECSSLECHPLKGW
jgi:4-diphosphocytidyl-2-C-methyl-D-erythritol kinase